MELCDTEIMELHREIVGDLEAWKQLLGSDDVDTSWSSLSKAAQNAHVKTSPVLVKPGQ